MKMPVAHLSRRYRFSASHRLHSPTLTDEQNAATYGKCNHPHGHGHNYAIEITVKGPVAPDTGFVVDLPKLDALMQREVLDRFDHVHLNQDVSFCSAFVPSTENVAIEVRRVLEPSVPLLDPHGLLRLTNVRIEETRNNAFDLPATMAKSHSRG